MSDNTVTLRSVYGKLKTYHFQPIPNRNGEYNSFVKKVRYNADGSSEMILSEADRNSGELNYFIPEDMEIIVKDGTTFDLNNQLEKNKWECIKNSELIVPTRDQRDEHGNLIIDGDSRKYGMAELYVEFPGAEANKKVQKKQLITKAYLFIDEDTVNGRLLKTKLLGRNMRTQHPSDVHDYLYTRAEKDPALIIQLYTSADSALQLMFMEGKEKRIIRYVNGIYMYQDNVLGVTDTAVVAYFKEPKNKLIVEELKKEIFPEYAKNIEGTQENPLDQVVVPNLSDLPITKTPSKSKTSK